MEFCTVTFNGNRGGTYYIPCDKVEYFTNNLINTSSSTVYLKNSLHNSQSSLICESNRYCYYLDNNRTIIINNASNLQFNFYSHLYRERVVINSVILFILVYLFFRKLID